MMPRDWLLWRRLDAGLPHDSLLNCLFFIFHSFLLRSLSFLYLYFSYRFIIIFLFACFGSLLIFKDISNPFLFLSFLLSSAFLFIFYLLSSFSFIYHISFLFPFPLSFQHSIFAPFYNRFLSFIFLHLFYFSFFFLLSFTFPYFLYFYFFLFLLPLNYVPLFAWVLILFSVFFSFIIDLLHSCAFLIYILLFSSPVWLTLTIPQHLSLPSSSLLTFFLLSFHPFLFLLPSVFPSFFFIFLYL